MIRDDIHVGDVDEQNPKAKKCFVRMSSYHSDMCDREMNEKALQAPKPTPPPSHQKKKKKTPGICNVTDKKKDR